MSEEKVTKTTTKAEAAKKSVKAAKATAKEAEESKELATTESNEITESTVEEYDLTDFDDFDFDDLSGIDAINASDIRVPYGKLYAKAQDGHNVGDVVLPNGEKIEGAEGDVLTGICILKIQPVRVFFPQPFKPSNTFVCRSLDGRVGAEDGEYAGRSCATCEFAQYPEGGGASPCREQMLLLCTSEDETLFYLLVTGIGVREFKRSFMSVEMMNGLRIVNRKLKKNILAALNLSVGVEFEDTDYGPFPKLKFKVDKESPLVDANRLRGNLEAYKSYKAFEDEAIRSAATFSHTEEANDQSEEPEIIGENDGMF